MTIEYTCLHEQQWCVCWWLNPIQSLVKSVRHYTQKLEKRLKVITEEKKMPVFEAVHSALISSDESDEEGDVLRTRPLEGRSEEASIFFFQNLDSRYRESMSNQQRRQRVNRRVGPPSTRGQNEGPESLLWAIRL